MGTQYNWRVAEGHWDMLHAVVFAQWLHHAEAQRCRRPTPHSGYLILPRPFLSAADSSPDPNPIIVRDVPEL